jgi:hypothetical protein
MIKLDIDGKEADVLQTESIVGEYAVAPIGDISKRVGARSIQFKLPKTARNKAIFESGEIPTSTSNKPYTNLSCRIYVDGVDMNMVFCQLETVDDNYNIRMYGGNSTLFADLKNKKLADLDLNHLNHHWNIAQIDVSKAKDYPLKYAVVDYNSDSPNSAIDETNDRAYLGCLYPVLYQHYLIEKCINEAGYALNNQTKDALMFQSAYPVVPLGSKNYERDTDFSRFIAKFNLGTTYAGLSLFGNWWNVDSIANQTQTYWVNGAKDNLPKGTLTKSSYFKIPDECRLKIRLKFSYKRGATSTYNPFNAVISIVPTSTPIIGSGTFGERFVLSVTDSWQNFDETVDIDCYYPIYPGLGEFHLPGFTIWVEKSDEFSVINVIETTDATVEILEASKFTDHERYITYNPTVDGFVVENVSTYISIANNLPDFSQADFIKQYLTATNSITTVDERNKVVTIVPYKKILDNITNAIDWTGKIDFTNRPKTEFKLDYAQNNYLKYKEDNDVIKPIGTDYNMTIDDERFGV